MNNSLVIDIVDADEAIATKTEKLQQREGELVKIIEAIRAVEQSDGWSTLKEKVFDGVLESLQHRLTSEAQNSEIDNVEMYKLQGQIAWAKKYSHLDTLADAFRLELINVRSQLNPPTERDTGS